MSVPAEQSGVDAGRERIAALCAMIEEGAIQADRGELVDGGAFMEEWRREDEAARRGRAGRGGQGERP